MCVELPVCHQFLIVKEAKVTLKFMVKRVEKYIIHIEFVQCYLTTLWLITSVKSFSINMCFSVTTDSQLLKDLFKFCLP